jgi:hypothetical protein
MLGTAYGRASAAQESGARRMSRIVTLSRREFMTMLSLAGAAALAPLSGPLAAAKTSPEHEWDWLIGNWDVRHRRLKERLLGSTDWENFGGKSALWLAMGGLGTIDDNLVELPAGVYRGLTIRTYDKATGQWSIWWLDSRFPAKLDAPVTGRFDGDAGVFSGPDTLRSKPIIMRFRWLDIHSREPHWEQAFSPDDGKTWEVNWENFFTRTATKATPITLLDTRPHDFDFLVGDWKVQHRRLRERLVGSTDWDEFDGTLSNWPVLGGNGNVGDNLMHFPKGDVRGIGLRSFDAASGEWLSWWFDGRAPTTLGPPVRGNFKDGIGEFVGDDMVNGKPVRTRVRWSQITPTSARWEQASSADGGATWEVNWISEFKRA